MRCLDFSCTPKKLSLSFSDRQDDRRHVPGSSRDRPQHLGFLAEPGSSDRHYERVSDSGVRAAASDQSLEVMQ